MSTKIQYFEYFLVQLVDWFCTYYKIEQKDFNDHPNNDLSKLKVFKLHFFACSTMMPDTLSIFDKFKALPYGHVESEVYSKLSSLELFELGNEKLEIKANVSLEKQNGKKMKIIEEMVLKLRKENEDLISWDAFKLVELSHKWFSWRYNYNKARQEHRFSEPISSAILEQEDKIYNLV